MTTNRLLTVLLGLALMSIGPAASSIPRGPHLDVIGATADELAMIEWATDRFEQTGLELPDLRIEFPGDPDGCFGFAGTYNHDLRRILMCNRGEFRTEPHQTLLHELVHAWAFTRLSEERIDAWVGLRQLESWNSRDLPWWQRGEEQAAEIVSWGLLDDDTRLLWLLLEDCDQLRDDFATITGADPLNQSNASCKDDGTGNRREADPSIDHAHHHQHGHQH